jgi:hypothetical protein
MKPSEAEFTWPANEAKCQQVGRSILLRQAVSHVQYWTDYARDFLHEPQPKEPYQRSWSEVAKKDRAYREMFATLTDAQRETVFRLLSECVTGSVFSTLCTFDQFPHGEAEIRVRDGVCGEGSRTFTIAPTDLELHEEFTQLLRDSDGERVG